MGFHFDVMVRGKNLSLVRHWDLLSDIESWFGAWRAFSRTPWTWALDLKNCRNYTIPLYRGSCKKPSLANDLANSKKNHLGEQADSVIRRCKQKNRNANHFSSIIFEAWNKLSISKLQFMFAVSAIRLERALESHLPIKVRVSISADNHEASGTCEGI